MSRPKSKEMDLTVGNPFWSLLKFAIPVILGNLFQLFYTLADSVIVGKTLGADSLAAVGEMCIRDRFQTAKQCRFHRTYIFHTLKKHRKTNCCANNNNNCNDDPGWKLQICRENPRPGQEKKYTSTNQHSPSCNREISPGCNNRPGQECINNYTNSSQDSKDQPFR